MSQPNSCDFCRRRKLKCSRDQPRCSQCIKLNKECNYTPRQKRLNITKIHVNQLEERILLLEKLVGRFVKTKGERERLLEEMKIESENDIFEDVDINSSIPTDDTKENKNLKADDYLIFDDFYNVDKLDWYEKDPTSNDDKIEFSKIGGIKDGESGGNSGSNTANTGNSAMNTDLAFASSGNGYSGYSGAGYPQNSDYDLTSGLHEPNAFAGSNTLSNQDANTFPENTSNTTSGSKFPGSFESNGLIDGMGALSLGDQNNRNAFYGISSSHGLLRFLNRSDVNNSSHLTSNYYSNLKSLYNTDNVKLLNSENSDIILDDPTFKDEFINSYFEIYHSCYPFLSRQAFLNDYEASKTKVTESKTIKEISFQVLLNTVLAIGALCKLGESSIIDLLYYKRVKNVLKQINIMECGSFQLLEAFTLLGNYTQKRNKPNTGWNYHGLSLRIATTFGLHKDINLLDKVNNPNVEVLEVLERRRRLWWGLFFFDVGHCVTFGRPLHLPILECIDIRYPLNIEEGELANMKDSITSISSIIKPYPTVYSGLISEAKLSKVSFKIYSSLTKVSGLKQETSISKMLNALELNNLIIDFKKNVPDFFQEDDMFVNSVLLEKCPPTWFSTSDNQQFIPKWFNLNRRRIIWRYKNLQILMFRSYIWESGLISEENDDKPDFVRDILNRCLNICYDAAKDTISTVSIFVRSCGMDTLTSWYSTYFLFQAVLIPILLLFKNSGQEDQGGANHGSKLSNSENSWLKDIESAKSDLTILKNYNSLAGYLSDTIDILTKPIFDKKKQTQGSEDTSSTETSNLGNVLSSDLAFKLAKDYTQNVSNPSSNYTNLTTPINEQWSDNIIIENSNFEFKDLPPEMIDVFSNVGIDFNNNPHSQSGTNCSELNRSVQMLNGKSNKTAIEKKNHEDMIDNILGNDLFASNTNGVNLDLFMEQDLNNDGRYGYNQ